MDSGRNELLYEALMLGRNKLVEKEEYLVATGNKVPASFRAAYGTVEISDVYEDTEAGISLLLSAPGYLEIEASCADDFIDFPYSVVNSDMFENNKYVFKFIVKADKLHNGKNFTEIIFTTAERVISIAVIVNNRVRINMGGISPERIRQTLVQDYMDFRLNKISREEWKNKAFSLIEDVNGNDPHSLFLILFRARLYISDKVYPAAKNLIDYAAAEVKKHLPEDRSVLSDLDCFLLYVITLYTGDPEGRNTALGKIEAAMKDGPSWQKLWMIFRLDKSYDVERGKKLNRIQQLFYYQKIYSPIMHLEALEVFLRRPEMIGSATDFELQVANFGMKQNRATEAIVGRLAELVNEMTDVEISIKNRRILIDIFKEGYQKYPGNNILKALCRLLVYTETRSTSDNIYFKAAISQFLDVEGINLYYLLTTDRERTEPLPDSVVEYFTETSEIPPACRSYFYANIIRYKKKRPEHYKRYLGEIIAFAEDQLRMGLIDRHTAVIYEDIIKSDLISHLMENDIFDAVCMKQIVCRSPGMETVMVIHDELPTYQEVSLEDGKALVRVYSSDALILFKDNKGNIFVNIDYDANEFIKRGEYIDLLIGSVPINVYMLTKDVLPLLRNYRNPSSVLKFMAENLGHGTLRPEYEKALIRDTVAYYKKHTNDGAIYDALLEFLRFRLDDESRAHLIEIMIERTMYRAAFEEIEKNGSDGIAANDIAKLCTVLTELPEYEDNKLLTKLCEISIRGEGYNAQIFRYLQLYYNDSPDFLIEMYRMARAYELNWMIIAERIIRRAIALSEVPESLPGIVDAYCAADDSDEDLKFTYLEFRAAGYIRGGDEGDVKFFDIVEKEVRRGFGYRLSDCVFASYLLYMSQTESAYQRVDIIKEKLQDLCDKNIMFEEFKALGKYFEIPSILANTYIVCVRTFEDRSRNVPHISYAIMGSGASREMTEPMMELFDGCYVRYFTLFKDDVLTYRVEDEEEQLLSYSSICPIYDLSRYSRLDQVMQLKGDDNPEKLEDAAREYFIRDKLADELF